MRPASTFLAAAFLHSAIHAQCIAAPGAAIPVLPDSITGPNAIGFAFPFAGGTYSDIHISDHGICFLTNAGVPATPIAVPLVYTPTAASLVANGPVICPHWSDTIPGPNGMFFLEATATVCTVTWVDIASFGIPAPEMTMQMRLFATGVIEFVYGPNVTNNSTFGGVSDNGIVGVSPGSPSLLPAGSDMSTGVTRADPTVFETFALPNTFDMGGGKLTLNPLAPVGWHVVFSPGGAGCATAIDYGSGCDGLALAADNLPILGTTWQLTVSGINPISTSAATYFALSREDPPVSLNAIGATGCFCHVSQIGDAVITATNAGTATASLSIPAISALNGFLVRSQSVALTDANAANFASSNGVEGTVGN